MKRRTVSAYRTLKGKEGCRQVMKIVFELFQQVCDMNGIHVKDHHHDDFIALSCLHKWSSVPSHLKSKVIKLRAISKERSIEASQKLAQTAPVFVLINQLVASVAQSFDSDILNEICLKLNDQLKSDYVQLCHVQKVVQDIVDMSSEVE